MFMDGPLFYRSDFDLWWASRGTCLRADQQIVQAYGNLLESNESGSASSMFFLMKIEHHIKVEINRRQFGSRINKTYLAFDARDVPEDVFAHKLWPCTAMARQRDIYDVCFSGDRFRSIERLSSALQDCLRWVAQACINQLEKETAYWTVVMRRLARRMGESKLREIRLPCWSWGPVAVSLP